MFFSLLVFVSARSTQIWIHEDETILKHKKGKHYNNVLVWEQRCRHRDTNDMTAVRDISSRYMQAFQSNRTFYGHTIKYNGNKASIEFHRRIEIKTIEKINRNGKKHTALFNSISLHCIHVFASLKFFLFGCFFFKCSDDTFFTRVHFSFYFRLACYQWYRYAILLFAYGLPVWPYFKCVRYDMASLAQFKWL